MRHDALTIVLVACIAAGCGDDDVGGGAPDADTREFDRRALLQHLGETIILPTYGQFGSDAAALETAISAYCDALGTADQATALTAARAAWNAAMGSWQRAEVMQIGPLAMDGGALRDGIYSWPVVSSCAVDRDVELKRTDATYDISTRLTNRRGLDALEYVLFSDDLNHSCGDSPTAPEGWNALPDAERQAARCAYAAAAAADVRAQADALVTAWVPSGGNYLDAFVNAPDAHEMLNVVSDAMFYVELEDKDMKLAQPAGIAENSCAAIQEPCPAELESQFARASKLEIAANLAAFDALFHGDTGIGFDDWLIAFNAEALAAELTADIAAARAAIDAIPGTMAEALAADYASVVDAHTAVKELTDDLKTQFLTVLGLDQPDASAGDND